MSKPTQGADSDIASDAYEDDVDMLSRKSTDISDDIAKEDISLAQLMKIFSCRNVTSDRQEAETLAVDTNENTVEVCCLFEFDNYSDKCCTGCCVLSRAVHSHGRHRPSDEDSGHGRGEQ